MNMCSYIKLCELLRGKDIKDAKDLWKYLEEWDVKNDISLDDMKEMYKNNKNLYFKNSIYKDDIYEIVIIYWCVGSKTPIHCHVSGGCIMKVLEGRLRIREYDDSDYSLIIEKSNNEYSEGMIEYIRGKHGIHMVENEEKEYAITIHIYMRK